MCGSGGGFRKKGRGKITAVSNSGARTQNQFVGGGVTENHGA